MRTVGWTLFTRKGLTEGKGRGVMREPRVTAVMRGWYIG